MTEYKERRLLLAAGGTGGHIWPALSFGAWIKEHHPECEVGYICGSRPLELEIYRAAGVEPTVLPMEGSPLSGGIVRSGRRIAARPPTPSRVFAPTRRCFLADTSLSP